MVKVAWSTEAVENVRNLVDVLCKKLIGSLTVMIGLVIVDKRLRVNIDCVKLMEQVNSDFYDKQ